MRRILCVAIVSLATVFCSTELFAQVRWGITGGLGWSQSKVSEIVEEKAPAGWNAGLTVSFDLPLGFSLQPTLRYHHKDALLTSNVGQKMDFVEFPLALQWGPDLLIFRPFFDITPFVGYGINGSFGEIKDIWSGDGLNRLEYGLGLGAGLDIWRFQVVCRYNWNFGGLLKTTKAAEDGFGFSDAYNTMKNGNFGGVSLSIAYFF